MMSEPQKHLQLHVEPTEQGGEKLSIAHIYSIIGWVYDIDIRLAAFQVACAQLLSYNFKLNKLSIVTQSLLDGPVPWKSMYYCKLIATHPFCEYSSHSKFMIIPLFLLVNTHVWWLHQVHHHFTTMFLG